ncbi:MAG: DUF493 domain-containing protein [Gammaproteobacteria bacterium]
MNSNQDSALTFPCRFPVKAMGLADPDFEDLVAAIARRHAPDVARDDLRTRASGGGKYVSVTVTINATSRAQLDNLYRELTACSRVLMAL